MLYLPATENCSVASIQVHVDHVVDVYKYIQLASCTHLGVEHYTTGKEGLNILE